MAAIASASAEKFRQLGWCENGEAPLEATNSCRPAADAAPASMRAPQACSFSPLTNNNTSHSRASSMHLTQWLDQASAVGSLLSELAGDPEDILRTCAACTIPLGCGEPSRARKWKSQADGRSHLRCRDRPGFCTRIFQRPVAAFNRP